MGISRREVMQLICHVIESISGLFEGTKLGKLYDTECNKSCVVLHFLGSAAAWLCNLFVIWYN